MEHLTHLGPSRSHFEGRICRRIQGGLEMDEKVRSFSPLLFPNDNAKKKKKVAFLSIVDRKDNKRITKTMDFFGDLSLYSL